MPTMPMWSRGRDVSAFSVTPQTTGVDGALTNGTAYSLVGLWDSAGFQMQPTMEEISAADAVRKHYVLIQEDWVFRWAQIIRRGSLAAPVNPMASILIPGAANYVSDVFLITISRAAVITGGSSTIQTYTFYGVRATYEDPFERNRNVATGSFFMVDPGQNNPVYPGATTPQL